MSCIFLFGALAGGKYKPKKKKPVVDEAALAQPSKYVKAKLPAEAHADAGDGDSNPIPWEGYKPATEINVCLILLLNC